MAKQTPKIPDERKQARLLGYLSILATATLIASLAVLGLTTLWFNRTSHSQAKFLTLLERQHAGAERLSKQAMVVSESRRSPRTRGVAVTPKYGAKTLDKFVSELGEWQSRQKILVLGDASIGLETPPSTLFGAAFAESDKYYAKLVEGFTFLRENPTADGDTPALRSKLAEMAKVTDPFRDSLRKVADVMEGEIKKRDALYAKITVACSLPIIITLLFIVFVMTKGNLARLNRAIRELEGAKGKLADSLSEAKTALNLSHMASRRFEQLFAGLPIGCFTCDAHGVIYEWNTAAEQLTGFAPFEVYMKSIYETVYAGGDHQLIRGYIDRVMAGEEINGVEMEETRKDGSRYTAMVNLLPMKGASGAISSVIIANADITALKIREHELAESREELRTLNLKLTALATTDGLTGLMNHRAFQETLERSYKETQVTSGDLSLVLLDVDRFKQFNDEFGHPAGDAVLRQVAKILAQTIGDKGYVARYGGEEFVVILPGMPAQTAMQVTELARVALEQATWPNREVTASFGVATLGAAYSQPSELIRDADQALYASKAGGRNQVTHFDQRKESVA
ncbi:MAG: sensor domain-containing diguanylate cyclase [Chthonomonas sp.]|nr:sensor domain-containing diguanylate cyclase [Chthonomonas sp.]